MLDSGIDHVSDHHADDQNVRHDSPSSRYGQAKKLPVEKKPAQLGEQLAIQLGAVLSSVPGCSQRPTDLARKLDASRVMISRVLTSIAKETPQETLTSIPGPETLRSIIRSAETHGVDPELTYTAIETVDAFDRMIRDQFGTRSALNAAMSVEHAGTKERFEQSSRYQVFKGMSQILGVRANVWLSCMMLTPNANDPQAVDITSIHGPSGLRRLRPDMPVTLQYGLAPKLNAQACSKTQLDINLEQYFAHTPAPITELEENGQLVQTFAPKIEGKDALYDMIASISIPAGSGRQAAPGRKYRGRSVIPDVPVVTLVGDVHIYGDIFENIEPELFVYHTLGKGRADLEDSSRDIDRVNTNDEIVKLSHGLENLDIQDVPKYSEMVHELCSFQKLDPKKFRTHRLQIQYPVFGFQYIIAYLLGQSS